MSHVVILTHAGVRCALPAKQVLRGEAEGDAPEIRLWRGDDRARDAANAANDGAVTKRALVVETPSGPRRLACEAVHFAWLDEEPMVELPELLRALLRLPHVVGLSESREAPLWLVDLLCWEER